MPIINLKLQGKQAIGDGTKIVCMNSGYIVQIECIDCDDLVNLPIKKLIIKAGPEYQEAPINNVGGKLQASLPIFDCQKTVELGVCGKQSEDDDPVYTSKPALFECEKSILCGTVVLKDDPKLERLEVRQNGTILASDRKVDGFYEVDVFVEDKPSEVRTVDLEMAGGNQLVEPSTAGRTMSQVVITKPLSLTPNNIRAGQSIGGVVGTFDRVLVEKEVFADGEYVPENADGFSKVTVKVYTDNNARLMRIGDSFSYKYDTSVNVTIDTAGIIKYENNGKDIIITAIGKGSCSATIKDLKADGSIAKIVHYAIIVDLESDYLLPVEAGNLEEMDLFLQEGVEGGIVKYTGLSSNGFVRDALYIIEGEGE